MSTPRHASMVLPSLRADGGVSLTISEAPVVGTLDNSTSKLLNRFYEPLHLLSMLNGDRGPGEVDLPSAPLSRGFRMSWRRFLDDLSWLCDNRHGGETVSAVAAQDLPEGITFWVASKHEASFHHLQWVLTNLKTAQDQTDAEASASALRLAEHSILFSKDKVSNYRRYLRVALSRVEEIISAAEDTELAAESGL